MTIFSTTGLPPQQVTIDERKRLAVRSRDFCLLNDTLYHKGVDGIWKRAVRQFEKQVILRESHCGIVAGHYAGEATGRKIWNRGFWWPTIMKDAMDYYWPPFWLSTAASFMTTLGTPYGRPP